MLKQQFHKIKRINANIYKLKKRLFNYDEPQQRRKKNYNK